MEDLSPINSRRPTLQVNVGTVLIGNGNPIPIQTMTTTLTHDSDATSRQIDRCVEAGAQIVRVAVPEERDAKALSTIVNRASVPIVADMPLLLSTRALRKSESILETLEMKSELPKCSRRRKPQKSQSASG